MKCNQFVM